MKRHQLIALAGIVLVACVDGGRSSGPNFAISDAAHGGAIPGFYFLPPIVPQPSISDAFNAFLQPLVTICKWSGTTCPNAPIAAFTRTSGTGSELIRVSTLDRHYIVNWHTDAFGVQPDDQYRIQIFADPDGTVLLGFADIKIAATGKEAKNITNGSAGETIGLVDGKTLPIKFFVGIGALGQCTPGGPTCAEAIVSPEDGGVVVAVNGDGEPEAFADFPHDWANEPITVKLERLPNTPPVGFPEGVLQWPLFYEFEAFVSDGEGGLVPFSGQFAGRVRIGVCNIDNPFGDPDHPEDRSTISLGIGRGEHFRTLPAANAADILGLCDGVTLAVRSGADAKGWRALLARAAAVATDVLLPRPLHASAAVVVDGGAGGSTDSFGSPVGTVKGRPDLVVHDISIFPTSPQPGDAITITAEIRNSGNLHAGRTLVTIDVGGQSPFEGELSCPNLDKGEVLWTASLAPFDQSEESCFVSRTVSFEAAGDFTVTARADAVGDLATESNEENNTRVATFTVAAAPRGQIAFARRADRSGTDFEIFLINVDGTGEINLTNNPALDADPAWSPNGARVAFQSRRADVGDVWVMNADGSSPVNLTNNPDAFEISPSWSRDGTKIAYVNRTPFDQIFVMNADGSNNSFVAGTSPANAGFPSWSPDGTKIAFATQRDGNSEIYVMNADGSNPVNLTQHPGFDFDPKWSPDGTKIAFFTSRDGNGEIYIMNADGSNPVNLTQNAALDRVGEWSPDSRFFTFSSDRDGNDEIYIISLDRTLLRRVTVNAAEDLSPAWRP